MLRTETLIAPTASTAVLPQVIAQSALLELSALELEERVLQELEENPALELRDETLPPLDYLPASRGVGSGQAYQPSESMDSWANLADDYCLKQELKQQFRAQNRDADYAVAELLIEALDDDGYLTISVEEAAMQLGVEPKLVEITLQVLQSMPPCGLGARNLPECLRLQLAACDPAEVPYGTEAVIDNLDFMTDGISIQQLRSLTRLSTAQLQAALEFIRDQLSPYPARGYMPSWSADHDVQYLYPDVVLSMDEDDCIKISIPQSERLAMRLNSAYLRLDEQLRAECVRTRDEQLKDARALVRQARQFIDNLTRRYRTMHKVMQAIVQHQDDFLMHGPAHLQPLSKKQIAIALGFHEATVCRATKDKYVLLPDGQLEPIDIFFDDALPAKSMIRRLVNSENKSAPLSDRMLQHELAGRGFDLARRTVTKYRMQLDIPPAGQRKAA